MAPAAGENQPNTVYDSRFSFIFRAAQRTRLYFDRQPDDAQGGRMSWVDLANTADMTT